MKTSVLSKGLPSDRDLNRWIKRVALLLVGLVVVFVAIYALDRFRPASPQIIDTRLAALEEAVRTTPSDISSRGQLADMYVTKGRYQDAIAQYNAILETGKAMELAYLGRARAYMGLEQWDAARADWEKVVEIAKPGEMANVDPTLEAAYYNLALIAMKQSRYADAVTNVESALKIKRSDADALFLAGQAYTETGDLANAELALRLSVQYVPIGWAEPYQALEATFVKAGRAAMAEWAKAMSDIASSTNLDTVQARLERLVDTEAGTDAAIGLGLYFETNGNLDKASEWYGVALQKQPTNAAARLGFGRTAPIQATPKPSSAAASQAPSASSGVKP